jgi:hypothetical protein
MIGITRSRVSYLEIWLDERAVDRNNLPIEPTNAELRLVPIGFCDAPIFASAIRIPAKQQGVMLEETDNAFTIRDHPRRRECRWCPGCQSVDFTSAFVGYRQLYSNSAAIALPYQQTSQQPGRFGYCLDVHRLSPLSRGKSSI